MEYLIIHLWSVFSFPEKVREVYHTTEIHRLETVNVQDYQFRVNKRPLLPYARKIISIYQA
jgi:hypothetical protein